MAIGFLPFIPGLHSYPKVCLLLQMLLALQAKLYPDSYQRYEGIEYGLGLHRKASSDVWLSIKTKWYRI